RAAGAGRGRARPCRRAARSRHAAPGADRGGLAHDGALRRRLRRPGAARARGGARFLSHGVRLALLGALPLAIVLLGLVLLHGILLPFVVGMAAAYLLDPAADWLQRLHLSRTAATALITVGFFVFLVVVVVLVLPAL